jgi:type IV secretory pathway TraG/TraD family ATPase VirD4
MIAALGRWANMPMPVALAQAWELDAEATAVFTNGKDPAGAVNDRFTTSAWGTFTTKFAPFLPHIESLSNSTIPDDWAEQNGAIFITWPMHHLKAVGPMVSAMIAGLLRQRMQRPRLPVLFAIDEAPAVALGNLADYMATVGGYGVTLLLYAQSVPQLLSVYRHSDVQAVLGNCHHQVWYPPQDTETAKMVSTIFGSRIELASSAHNPGGSWLTGTSTSTRYRPALEDAQAMSLPEGEAGGGLYV